jgi:hypothetical protein
MNELKKGDRCNTPWGAVEFVGYLQKGEILEGERHCKCMDAKGDIRFLHVDHLTLIPTHADRMQKMIDIAFDAENRLEDGEVVQLPVGELAAFVRHYVALVKRLEAISEDDKLTSGKYASSSESIEKLLKGEA